MTLDLIQTAVLAQFGMENLQESIAAQMGLSGFSEVSRSQKISLYKLAIGHFRPLWSSKRTIHD